MDKLEQRIAAIVASEIAQAEAQKRRYEAFLKYAEEIQERRSGVAEFWRLSGFVALNSSVTRLNDILAQSDLSFQVSEQKADDHYVARTRVRLQRKSELLETILDIAVSKEGVITTTYTLEQFPLVPYLSALTANEASFADIFVAFAEYVLSEDRKEPNWSEAADSE